MAARPPKALGPLRAMSKSASGAWRRSASITGMAFSVWPSDSPEARTVTPLRPARASRKP